MLDPTSVANTSRTVPPQNYQPSYAGGYGFGNAPYGSGNPAESNANFGGAGGGNQQGGFGGGNPGANRGGGQQQRPQQGNDPWGQSSGGNYDWGTDSEDEPPF